jgi:hypothetical protein
VTPVAVPAHPSVVVMPVCLQHIQVKHLLKILSVSQLSQPSRILFGEWQPMHNLFHNLRVCVTLHACRGVLGPLHGTL